MKHDTHDQKMTLPFHRTPAPRRIASRALLLLLPGLLLFGACGESTDENEAKGDGVPFDEEEEFASPGFGTKADLERARQLWMRIDGFTDWQSPEGQAGWQEGQSPHGKFLRLHANEAYLKNPDDPPAGAVIVKLNYAAQDLDDPGPVTIMEKREPSEDSESGWFWAKLTPDGDPMTSPKNFKLVGEVTGCVGCHAGAAGDDHVFLND